jgi:hypothetical protein
MTTAGKPIPNADYLAECFVYVAGNLIWKHRPISHFSNARTAAMWNAKNAEKRAGRLMLVGGYTQIGLDGRRFLAHRLIASMHGIDTSGVVDHINGNPGDNRICNLRDIPHSENVKNVRLAMRDIQDNSAGSGTGLRIGQDEAVSVTDAQLTQLEAFRGAVCLT